ncbi:hypothetical protein EUGRSUZ_L00751, partial [Eucalyptus grandis]
MDGSRGGDDGMDVGDPTHDRHPMQPHYRHHHGLQALPHLSNGNDMNDDHDGGGGGGGEGVEGDVPSDAGNDSDNRGGGDDADQLTLSFQGQVYVFDSVPPQKVQAVLLLLGAREVTPNPPAIPVATNQNQ